MKPPSVDFSAGLRALREKLGLTQEGMALCLGASLGTYRKWEAGAFNPSGPWLVKILQVCPDEETRALLGAPRARAASRASEQPSLENRQSVGGTDRRSSTVNSSEPPPPTRATLLARYRNVCIEGIELLYDLARGNSEVARYHLHSIAEEVSRKVGSLTRADHDNALRNLPNSAPSSAPSNRGDETPPPPPRRKPTP